MAPLFEQYIILDLPSSGSSSHRIARRRTRRRSISPASTPWSLRLRSSLRAATRGNRAAPSPVHYPPSIPYPDGGFDYDFTFWSITGIDLTSPNPYAQIIEFPNPNESFSGGAWMLDAKASYFRNFDEGGPGDEALYIDMFDATNGTWLAPDFVDVTPDPTGTLTANANDGYIDTSAQITDGAPITVAARDRVSNWQFDHWFSVPSLQHSHNPNTPQIGAPDPHDLVIGRSDDVVAFAFYDFAPQRLVLPQQPATYDPWWWIKTHGGLIDPGGPEPWQQRFAAALSIASAARTASPELRKEIVDVALRQIALATTELKKGVLPAAPVARSKKRRK